MDEIGWPGLLHTGLHFTLLFETSDWAWIEDPARPTTRAESHALDGKPLARLDAAWAPVTRAQVEAWDVPLPAYLRDAIPE